MVSTMPSPLRLVGMSLIAVALAACSVAGGTPSGEPSESPAGGIAYPTGANDLVIRLRYVGGFAPPSAHVLDLPVISIYGDGSVIVPGAVPAIYPGPALPNLQRATITTAGMQILLAAARDAGLLGPDAHYDMGGIMDASSSEFTVNADGSVHTISAYALFESGGREPQNPGADPAVTEARARLLTFQNQLGNLEALLGPDVGDAMPYVADAVATARERRCARGRAGPRPEPDCVAAVRAARHVRRHDADAHHGRALWRRHGRGRGHAPSAAPGREHAHAVDERWSSLRDRRSSTAPRRARVPGARDVAAILSS